MSLEDERANELSMLLYVSESMIQPEHGSAELDTIVACAKQRNSTLGITGSLVFTGTHFAQLLEGRSENLQTLMSSIKRDPRHTKIIVCVDRHISVRRFPNWALAYAGPSQYIAKRVTAPMAADPSYPFGPFSTGLIALMNEFLVTAKATAVWPGSGVR